MGIRNRQRRAAKVKAARQRARHHHRREGGTAPREGSRPLSGRERVRALIRVAAITADPAEVDLAIAELALADATLVDREAEGSLLSAVVTMWEHGWQPSELVRHVRRVDGRAGRLAAAAVAADHAMRDPATLHPRWAAQIDSLELPEVADPTGWVTQFARREWVVRTDVVAAVVTTLIALLRAGVLHTILPPPGSPTGWSSPVGDGAADDPVLVKVRALLAQAESTTFEAEAEAFTAKAQELMARHAIDAALLWAASPRDERPTSIRVAIDDPYADIKSLLLQHVARHSRCRGVWDAQHGLSTVIGFASDVAAAELLFTSLLVQSQSALRAEGAKAGPGARTRSRLFRSSFLFAFTHRIDQRLAEINTDVQKAAEAEHSGSLLPVLARRDDAVGAAVDEQFGPLNSSAVRAGSDAAGWARGTLAADLAKLNAGDLDGPTRPVSLVRR
ncbi:MAG: DUF2786 domain-containing protein [Ilumatobacteraceae bacterium]